eukprot:8601922-Pyramimonas_sp.AAC.1
MNHLDVQVGASSATAASSGLAGSGRPSSNGGIAIPGVGIRPTPVQYNSSLPGATRPSYSLGLAR